MKLKTSYIFYNLLIIKTIVCLHYFIDFNKLKQIKNNKENTILCYKKDEFNFRNYWILYYLYFVSFYCFVRINYFKLFM